MNLTDFDGKIGSLHVSGVVRLSFLVWLDLRFGCAVFLRFLLLIRFLFWHSWNLDFVVTGLDFSSCSDLGQSASVSG
jgi:hypothetical protein